MEFPPGAGKALYTDWYSKTIYMDGRLFLAAYLHINLITEVKMSSGDAKETDAKGGRGEKSFLCAPFSYDRPGRST